MKTNYSFLKIIIAILIFLLVFFSGLIKDIYIAAIFGGIGAAVSYVTEPIFNLLADRNLRKSKETLIKSYTKDITSFLKFNFEIQASSEELIEAIKEEDFDVTKDEVYKRAIKIIRTDQDKEILLILALTKEIDKEKDISLQSRYRSKITEVLQTFDTLKFDAKTQQLMKAYTSLYKIKDENYKDLFLTFAQKYSNLQVIALRLFNDLNIANEFKRTISLLLVNGRLNLHLVKGETKKKIDELLKAKQIPRGFIVIMNKYEHLDSIKKALSKFPQIQIGRLTPYNFPENTKYLSMKILYPKTYYTSANEFLNKEILSRIPEEEKGNGFVAVLPLEITEIQSYPKTEADIESDIMKKSFKAINYLITGQDKSVDDILAEYTISNITISELLAVIPFNIFVPHMNPKAKYLIIDNYPEIQRKFQIKTLFDWAEVDTEELSSTLVQYDKDRILLEAEWQKIAIQICTEAQKHAKALE
ncbi:MAG: hypothetical protein QXL94_07915 [Candidatus Parvarchaeum sp.]